MLQKSVMVLTLIILKQRALIVGESRRGSNKPPPCVGKRQAGVLLHP